MNQFPCGCFAKVSEDGIVLEFRPVCATMSALVAFNARVPIRETRAHFLNQFAEPQP